MSISLLDFFRSRMVALNPKIRSEATRKAYEVEISVLEEYFRTDYLCRPSDRRELLLSDLCTDLVGGAAAWQVRRGRSPATANRLLRQIGSIWAFAATDEKYGSIVSPPKKLAKHKEPKRIPEAWSPDEFASLITASAQLTGNVGSVPANVWWPSLLLTAYWTGARISAIMALPVENVDLRVGEVKFPAETQKQYADQGFELPADVADFLRRLNPAARGHKTFFGDWPFDRTVPQWRVLGKHFTQIVKSCGLKTGRRYKFHMIRRTFATQITAKEGVAVAQSMLGHADIKTTQRYIDPRFVARPKATLILPAMPVPVVSEGLRVVG